MNYLFYFPEYLQADSLISLILSFALFLTGVIFFRSRELLLKIFLFAGGVAVGYFACSLDQFLHNWDEQYHALVAKNLMADFLKPVLYKNEILASSHWTGCHIWLHKQPLFLWEIAISMKIFGVNELAVRLPSIISHGLIILMVYDIGKFIKGNLAGILTALIFAYMKFPLTYVAGMYATDHNDIAFLLYVTASFWSLIKYRETQKIRYVILCGLFSGAAVLVKWLTGFLAIGVWGSYTLIFERKKVIKPILAGLIAVIVALPWQLYCYFNYRQIFLSEMSFNSKHVSEAVEGHSGNWLFHFSELKNLYSDTDIIFILLGFGVIYFLFNKSIDQFYKYLALVSILLVYTFFSIVKTKMPAFCFIVAPFVLITFTSTLVDLLRKVPSKKIKVVVCVILISQLLVMFFSPSYFIKRHTLSFRPKEHLLRTRLYEKNLILEIGKQVQANKLVFINTKGLAVRFMFYLNCDATNEIPTRENIQKLKDLNYKIIAINSGLPDYILTDKEIQKM